MLFFNVYYSKKDEGDMVEFDVTCGDSLYGLNMGTKEWMEDVLQGLGHDAEVKEWQVIPCRCVYVSEYFSEATYNWKDRWLECWHVKIRMEDSKITFENVLDESPRKGTSYIDTTFDEGEILQENGIAACNHRVLIIADYKLTEGEKSIKTEKLSKIIRKYWKGEFQMEEREFPYGIWQYRVLLEENEVFPASLSSLDQMIHDIDDDGGVVNYQQRFPKIKVNFLEKPASKELSSDAPEHMKNIMIRLKEMRKEIKHE